MESSSYERFCDVEIDVEGFLGTAGKVADLFEVLEEIFAIPVAGRPGVPGFTVGLTDAGVESQLGHFPFASIGSPH